LLERVVNLNVEETQTKPKASLADKGCQVAVEQPAFLRLRQGSLWGLSPKSAKKTIDIRLKSQGDQTVIKTSSVLSPDWKNITVVGCILAAALATVCLWMAFDLTSFLATGQTSFWSWLIAVNSNANMEVGETFVRLVWGIAGFLVAVIALEAVIFIHAQQKIDAFAAEILDEPC
jgi:hypothetical protein